MQAILCRLPNWVGDVIMTLPSLALLQQQEIEINVFGKPWIHQLLAGYSFTCHSWPSDKIAAVKSLRQQSSQHLLLFTNSFSSALLGRLAGKTVIGYQHDARGFLLNQSFERPREPYEAKLFYHLTCRFLGLDPAPLMSNPCLRLSEACLQTTRHLIEEYQLPPQFVLLCPFAHGLSRQGDLKTWPYWQAFYEHMQDMNLVICPGPNELEQAYQYFPNAKIIPSLSLDQYAALASQAQLVIANDSGPMHLAAAVSAPTIGLFGATDPKRAAPANIQVLGRLGQWPSLIEVLDYCKTHLS